MTDDVETELVPDTPGHQRAEKLCDSRRIHVVGEPEGEPGLGPGGRQPGLDALPLPYEAHERQHKLRPVAKVEGKRGSLSQERLRVFMREMLLIRHFEEKVEERFRAGDLPGFLHVAIGQEGVAVGVCQAMEDGDVFASTHRAHGHTLARGTHPNEVMAELYGKLEGCSHGYGGSMHLYDVERGNLGANAVVGGGLPAIVGAALSFKLRGQPRVAVAFFGDGATNIGTFHEALNLAQLWTVPAVFVLENNHWAESTPAAQQLPIADLEKRAVAYGMHSAKVDGQDVEAVHRAARRALEYARSGKGPVFLDCETYRLVGHFVGDAQVYRRKGEQQELRETQDPITKLREKLELSDEEFEALDVEAREIADASVEFARAGTDPKPEDALKNVYA
jgi:TPP-dependent pyruvate/acetoin dehydrogenase alpha subunit